MTAEICPRPGDGRISRDDAAVLARVKPDTISSWITRGYISDVRREGKRVWLSPAEVLDAEHRLHERERARDALRRELLEAVNTETAPAAGRSWGGLSRVLRRSA